MPSTFHAVSSAIAALTLWSAIGYPVCRRLLPASMALPFAPVAGWAMHGVVAIPVFFFVPFSTAGIAVVASLALGASGYLAFLDRRASGPEVDAGPDVRVPPWAWLAAALLAIAVTSAIVPKQIGNTVVLADQIFDHAKVALVDDIARLGLPPGNPFIAHDGGSGRLSYYYLWHFSAAELSRSLAVSGWEAEIAMTFFSAFTSLAAMMAVAVRFSGRAGAALWVVALAASSSSRILLIWLFGGAALDTVVRSPGGFGGWFFQSSWVPQHLASTSCVLLALLLMQRLSNRRSLLAIGVLGTVAAAAFESSTWIGGVVFALVAVAVVPLLWIRAERARRLGFVAALAAVALLTLLLAWPLLADQLASSALRKTGSPIAVRALVVLGNAVPDPWKTVLDAPAFWLLMLPIELTAIYVPGLFVLLRSLWTRGSSRSASTDAVPAFAVATVAALLASWLLASTLADNNDLAWRAVLLASTLLIVFAGVGLAGWIGERRWLPAGLALFAIVLGVPETALQVHRNWVGHDRAEDAIFAQAPRLWAAVRAHASGDERIANNPLALAGMTPWPVNIGWSLLAHRRSCYAGWELTQVYTAVPHDRLREIDAQFIRVFGGNARPDDVRELATLYDCSVVVVTPQDGAWATDPFRTSAFYGLVDEDARRWRIYRRR